MGCTCKQIAPMKYIILTSSSVYMVEWKSPISPFLYYTSLCFFASSVSPEVFVASISLIANVEYSIFGSLLHLENIYIYIQ